ncbi:MAG: hypothetical protein HC913_01685 [Microscillaceae bacterium]|nr:hypothetical protein [Microscillaceae bacterium]
MIDGQTKGYLSLGGGAFWGMDDEMGRQKAFLGISYLNFTEPDVAFVEGMGANLPASFVATGGGAGIANRPLFYPPQCSIPEFCGQQPA